MTRKKNSWGRTIEKIKEFITWLRNLNSLWNRNIQCHIQKNPPLDYFKDKNPAFGQNILPRTLWEEPSAIQTEKD
jgi:hypothetical protein